MNKLLLLGLGAGAMYLFDPRMGRRRRALVRDKAVHYSKKLQCAVDTVGQDLANRVEGMRHEGPSLEKLGFYKENWAPATRFIVGAAGTALELYAMTRGRGLRGLMGLGALGLIAEALTNAHILPHHRRAQHNGKPQQQQQAAAEPSSST